MKWDRSNQDQTLSSKKAKQSGERGRRHHHVTFKGHTEGNER